MQNETKQSYYALMPSRHRVKTYASESYYHVYNRGVERRNIFMDNQDYAVFLGLLKRHLSGESMTDRSGRVYEDLSSEVELLAYCLMPNHVHLLLYQQEAEGMTRLLRRVMTAYGMYFNRKYRRIGSLFQDRFKGALIGDEPYLWHISRYIHLNPQGAGQPPSTYPYSSYRYYVKEKRASWLRPGRILEMHEGEDYREFLADWADYRATLIDVERQLA